MGIQFKRSTSINSTPNPTQVEEGEITINMADKLVYTKDHNNKIINIGFSKDYADASYLKLTGGILSGRLQLEYGTMPYADDDVISKRYVDSRIGTGANQAPTNSNISNLYVPRSGTTMTGYLTVLTPTSIGHAATKGYADSTFFAKTGGDVYGAITWAGTPINNGHLTTKSYVDNKVNTAIGGINLSIYLRTDGGSVTGNISSSVAPTASTHLTTKQYVDAAIVAGYVPIDTSNFVLRTGSVLTGALSYSPAPASPSHLSNKAYVDSAIAAALATNKASIMNSAFPVGYVYLSMVSTNPSILLGIGTWAAIAQGRTLVGVGTGNDGTTNKTFAANTSGGEYNHRLTLAELAEHTHVSSQTLRFTNPSNSNAEKYVIQGPGSNLPNEPVLPPETAGNSAPHNNIQPYITTYIWQRIS